MLALEDEHFALRFALSNEFTEEDVGESVRRG